MGDRAEAHSNSGECRLLFAVDIAHGIDLAGASRAVRDPSHEGQLGRSHPAPSYFKFTPPPLRVHQRGEALPIGRWKTSEAVEVVLFDFGAVLVSYTIALTGALEECVELSSAIAADTTLAQAARERVEQLARAISAHLTRPGSSALLEDYSIFRFGGAALQRDADAFLRQHETQLAAILRAERQPLSREVVSDALSVRLQYGPDDLSLVDWHAAVVFDDDPLDVVRVLEFANVQLLEMRFLDAQLDDALEKAMAMVSRRDARGVLGPLALQRDLRRLSNLQLEAAFLFERLGNTLKISGDPFLARLLRQASARYRLDEWNAAAQRKLSALDNVYAKLHDHAASLRAEFLELLIVLMIAFEIVMSLL